MKCFVPLNFNWHSEIQRPAECAVDFQIKRLLLFDCQICFWYFSAKLLSIFFFFSFFFKFKEF